MTLTEFILARIAEDEQVARDLADWTKWEVPIFRLFDDDPESQADLDAKDYAKVFAQLMRAHEVPARELAQCAALRAVVGLHQRDPLYGGSCSECSGADDEPARWPCPTLRALAAIWSDHPDHQEVWDA